MTAATSGHSAGRADEAEGAEGTTRSSRPRRAGRTDSTPPEGRAHRRRIPTALWCVAGVFAVLFAAASLQARLISGQERLDRINAEIDVVQVRQDDLRQQEANLRSPAQIAAIATNELGMVQAAPPMLVNPPSRYIGSPHPQVAPTTTLPPASISEVAAGPATNGNG